jgi:MurNAc alpha-1-phosphate uridylyltransferase
MIFAAGFGTRMGALTRDRPKPLVEVAGRPLIDHALPLLRAAGCAPIVANLHYKPEALERHLQGSDVRTTMENPDILDTGGGLRAALPLLSGNPVVTMNPDVLWQGPNPVSLLQDAWDPERMDALLMTIPPERVAGHKGAGDFIHDADGTLTRGPGVIYGGTQIIKTDLLHKIQRDAFSLNAIWDILMDRGRLHGLTYPGRWCDVGNPEGIVLAEKMLAGADV